MKAYDVYMNGNMIDRVYFQSDDADEVRRSLIEWDNYHDDIEVREAGATMGRIFTVGQEQGG